MIFNINQQSIDDKIKTFYLENQWTLMCYQEDPETWELWAHTHI